MSTQAACGGLLLYPAFQEGGELRLSSAVLREVIARRFLDVPFAFLFAVDEDAPPAWVVCLGSYSPEHQVWAFDPEAAGSEELVPRRRRVETTAKTSAAPA